MNKIDRKFITDNIIKLITYSGVDDVDFAYLIDKSVRTIARIRNQETLFNIESINIAVDFFNIPLDKLNTEKLKYIDNYRITLKELHKNNLSYSSILNKTPSISYAIEYYLLRNKEFNKTGLVVKQIQSFFENYNWKYTSSYISLAMERNKDKIDIIGVKIFEGKKVNIYSSKND